MFVVVTPNLTHYFTVQQCPRQVRHFCHDTAIIRCASGPLTRPRDNQSTPDVLCLFLTPRRNLAIAGRPSTRCFTSRRLCTRTYASDSSLCDTCATVTTANTDQDVVCCCLTRRNNVLFMTSVPPTAAPSAHLSRLGVVMAAQSRTQSCMQCFFAAAYCSCYSLFSGTTKTMYLCWNITLI